MAHGETGADGAGSPGGPEPLVLVDEPAASVRRLTLNRPAKRNALSNALRGELFAALREADAAAIRDRIADLALEPEVL